MLRTKRVHKLLSQCHPVDRLLFLGVFAALDESSGRKKARPERFTRAEDPAVWRDSTCLERTRFTWDQLGYIRKAFDFPPTLIIRGARESCQYCLAVLCARIGKGYDWKTMADLFQRSERALHDCYDVALELFKHFSEAIAHVNWSFYRPRMEYYTWAVEKKAPRLKKCWGFVDAVKIRSSRNSLSTDAAYDGHKSVRGYGYQGICAPDGLIVSFYGPLAAPVHDTTMLRQCGFLDEQQDYNIENFGDKIDDYLYIYGDHGYKGKDFIGIVSPLEETDQAIRDERRSGKACVEHCFGIIKKEMRIVTDEEKLLPFSSRFADILTASAILTNCRTCILKGNQVTDFFDSEAKPPTLVTYALGLMEFATKLKKYTVRTASDYARMGERLARKAAQSRRKEESRRRDQKRRGVLRDGDDESTTGSSDGT